MLVEVAKIELKANGYIKINILDLEFILKKVCEVSGIGMEAIKSVTRKREVVEAKQAYFLLAMKLTKNSLVEIGRIVSRSHATVFYAKKNEFIPEIQQIIKNTNLL